MGGSADSATVGFAPAPRLETDGLVFFTQAGQRMAFDVGFSMFDYGPPTFRISAQRNLQPIGLRVTRYFEDQDLEQYIGDSMVTWDQEERYGLFLVELDPPQTPGTHMVTLTMEGDFGLTLSNRLSRFRYTKRYFEHYQEESELSLDLCLDIPDAFPYPEGTSFLDFVDGGATLRFAGFEDADVSGSTQPKTISVGQEVDVEAWLTCCTGPTSPEWVHYSLVDIDGDLQRTWQEARGELIDHYYVDRSADFTQIKRFKLRFDRPGQHRLQIVTLSEYDDSPTTWVSNVLVVNVSDE